MIKFFTLLFILTHVGRASAIDVCSFNEGDMQLKIPSSKRVEKDYFVKQHAVSQSKLDDIHRPFHDAWTFNNVAAIMDLHEQWMQDSRSSQLLGFFFFPAGILNTTACTSYYEHNEAVKLSILIAAKFKHIEARMIASTIFNDSRFSPEINTKFEELHKSVQSEIEDKAQAEDREAVELVLDSVLSKGNRSYIEKYLNIVETYVSQDVLSHCINARTFLRLGKACTVLGDFEKAHRYYDKAALKGSKRAVAEMVNGLIVATHLSSHGKLTQIHAILQSYQSKLAGYGHLIIAQYFQFGVGDIVERNLKKANSFYRTAAEFDFPQACIDYGDFLLTTTNVFPNDREKVRKFYGLAIDSYAKSGTLGITNGYIKAAQTLLHCMREQILSEGDLASCHSKSLNFYQKALFRTVDPLLMEKLRENSIDEGALNDLQQYQFKLQLFIKNTFESAFSLSLDEVD